MIQDIDSPSFARDVARRTRRGRRALVVKSTKSTGGDPRVESALERDISLMLDLDPRVLRLAGQPFTLELQSNEILPSREHYRQRPGVKPRFYTPDFLCELDDGRALAIDAKHSSFIGAFETKRVDISGGLRPHGIGFVVIPETVLSRTMLQNVASLHLLKAGYQAQRRLTSELELAELLDLNGAWLCEDLAARLTFGRVGVLAGLLAGLICADLSKPLFTPTSESYAAYGDLSHLHLLEKHV